MGKRSKNVCENYFLNFSLRRDKNRREKKSPIDSKNNIIKKQLCKIKWQASENKIRIKKRPRFINLSRCSSKLPWLQPPVSSLLYSELH